MRRGLVLLFLGTAAVPAGLRAQDEEKIPARMDWYPYLMGDPNHGFLLVGRFQVARQAEYNARVPFDWYAGVEGAYGTRGSRLATVRVRAPLLIRGWRFSSDAGAGRIGRFGYYGQGAGGDSGIDDSEHSTDFFRAYRTRYYGQVEVTRQIKGPFHVAAAAGLASWRFRSVTDTGLFALESGGATVSGTDATGRLTLVLDTRNNELIPANGLLLEAGIHGGTGGGGCVGAGCEVGGYAGVYAHLRGYFSPQRGIVFAGRAAFLTIGAKAPLDARYIMPGWERDLSVFGGFDSNRGYVRGRLAGRRIVMTSAEVRYDLVDGGDYGALTVLGFVDAGKVGDGDPVTFSGWKVGVGAGLAIRVLRQAILTLHFARGPDGFNFTMGNGWSF